MGKRSKQSSKGRAKEGKVKKAPEGLKLLEELERPRSILLFFGLLFLLLLFFYSPLVFEGLEPGGSDVVSDIGKTHQIRLFEKESGKRALWNPYMFGGMPIYHRYGTVVWSFDVFLSQLGKLVDWRVWYMLVGAMGMFLLVKFLGLSAPAGMLAALAFILMPHFQALIIVGHFAKLRALIWMPLVLLTFLLLLKRRNLLSMLLFSLTFSLQMRTQHYQIIFYTLLLLLFMGILLFLRLIMERRWGEITRFSGLFVMGLILVILVVAHPLISIKDYTPYSTRGGNAVSLKDTRSAKDTRGVGFDYATNWSYSLSEFWNLIVPKFHGGTSQEVYTGDAVPQFRNRVIPAYWGSMPFTQSYEYMGIVLVFLAVLAMLFCWQRVEVKSLSLLTGLALLLALGRHFAALYKLFFYYVPYFDKFRVPMMILTLVMFNVAVLAAIGLDFLLGLAEQAPPVRRKFYILTSASFVLLFIPLFFGSGFSLTQPSELQRYASQYGQEGARQFVDMLRRARLDILHASAQRSLIFLILGAGFIVAFLRKWVGKDLLIPGLIFIVAIDLGLVSKDYLKGKFQDPEQMEAQNYQATGLDGIIQQDKTMFRVCPPLRQITNDTRWSYYYQSIGGYAAAKLQVIQDIIENNLFATPDADLPFNLKILSMLNGKYLIANTAWNHPALRFLGEDKNRNWYLYENVDVLPRVFFVDSVRVIPDGVQRLKFMNAPDFAPRHLALLEEPLPIPVAAPDSGRARVTHFEPDQLVVETYTNKPALLVMSEVYYPRGWQASLEDSTRLKIYKTNHLLRSVVVPEGQHLITFEFKPKSYYMGKRLSLVGLLIIYAGLVFLICRHYGDRIMRLWVRTKMTP